MKATRGMSLRERVEATELLDSGELAPADVEANLADLARLNRLPGGRGASLRAVERLVDGRPATRILDVGTGAADIPLAFARRGWRTVAVDTNPDVLSVARRRARNTEGVEIIEADARRLPFDDASFDIVHSSLLLHHLAPDEAVAALAEMRRVARAGVVINDLRRGVIPLAVTAVTVVALGRSRVTRIDGMTSVRRAYTVAELDALLEHAGLRTAWRSIAWMPRVATVAVAR